MAHDEIQDSPTSVRSRTFWVILSLLVAALFFYAASTSTGGGEAFAQSMADASASADWSGSASMMDEDSSM